MLATSYDDTQPGCAVWIWISWEIVYLAYLHDIFVGVGIHHPIHHMGSFEIFVNLQLSDTALDRGHTVRKCHGSHGKLVTCYPSFIKSTMQHETVC
jgi:hypothetical protein